jgi:F-type H+-transporting ATPase subunit epsilon
MAEASLPKKIALEVVTPEGLLVKEDVESVQAPGESGYFGVLPGHTPFLSMLGVGVITYRKDGVDRKLTCFWGFCEVLPDKVNILAEIGERAEDIDAGRAEAAKNRAEAQLKAIKGEAGFAEAKEAYTRAVTRLAATRKS